MYTPLLKSDNPPMSKRFVALLRGINVGGKNLIPMAALKSRFEELGLRSVSTYIQSGNVLFEYAGGDREKLAAEIERTLLERFQCASRAHLLSTDELERVVKGAPRGFGSKPLLFRYDVLFLMTPLTSRQVLSQLKLKEGVDAAHAGKGAVYFSRLIKKAAQSRLSRVVQLPVYKQMTLRNWNTSTKLLSLLRD